MYTTELVHSPFAGFLKWRVPKSPVVKLSEVMVVTWIGGYHPFFKGHTPIHLVLGHNISFTSTIVHLDAFRVPQSGWYHKHLDFVCHNPYLNMASLVSFPHVRTTAANVMGQLFADPTTPWKWHVPLATCFANGCCW